MENQDTLIESLQHFKERQIYKADLSGLSLKIVALKNSKEAECVKFSKFSNIIDKLKRESTAKVQAKKTFLFFTLLYASATRLISKQFSLSTRKTAFLFTFLMAPNIFNCEKKLTRFRNNENLIILSECATFCDFDKNKKFKLINDYEHFLKEHNFFLRDI